MLEPKDTALLITAAGRSSRMGFPKGLLTFEKNGKTLIETHCERFLAFGGRTICIVHGTEHVKDKIYESLFLDWPISPQFVENKDVDHTTMFHSIQIGLKNLQNFPAIFVMPVDVAPFDDHVFAELLSVWREANISTSWHGAIIPELRNRRGHPVMLSQDFYRYLIKKDPNETRLDVELSLLKETLLCPVSCCGVIENLNSLQ